jgi:hypothetical protein
MEMIFLIDFLASYYLSVGLLRMQLPVLKHRGLSIFFLIFSEGFQMFVNTLNRQPHNIEK